VKEGDTVKAKLIAVTVVLGMTVLALLTGCAAIKSSPVASFTCNPSSGESPLTVSFDASSSYDSDGTIAIYSWSFGDGSSGSGVTTSHTYSTAGTYTAQLTVTDDDGAQATASHVISVTLPSPNSPPVASFTRNPSSGKAPLNVSFNAAASHDSDGSIVSYEWSFGDGGSDTGVTTSHTYQNAGTYTAVLRVTDNNGSIDTASRSITVTVVVNQPPVAAFSFVRDPTDAHTFIFDASASADSDGILTHWAWDFGDDTGLTVSQSLQIMNHRYMIAGTYAVTLTVYDNDGMSNAVTHTIAVPTSPSNQSPIAVFSYLPTNPVVGSAVFFDGSASSDPDGTISAYLWNFGDGYTSNIGPTVYHQFVASGTHTIALEVIDNGGMTDTVTHVVTVTAP
jgi:PKD repeat protein